jgi:hypothetical protein
MWRTKMVNNRFADDYLISFQSDQGSVGSARKCLNLFFITSRVVMSDQKIDFQLISLDEPTGWILLDWKFIQSRVIVHFLGFPSIQISLRWTWGNRAFKNYTRVSYNIGGSMMSPYVKFLAKFLVFFLVIWFTPSVKQFVNNNFGVQITLPL